MPEQISDKKVFSLLEVTLSIQKTISERYQRSFWVKAEMNKLNHYSYSGHCYPELVEKREGRIVAQTKSVLWKNDFLRINERFLSVLKEPIKDGINILFNAAIIFDPVYGLSLQIIDIDPGFSLGELEREKQETIDRLLRDGIFDNNKKLELALLPKRIAVISVETSKGFSDYLKIIEQNPWGYRFFNYLFPAILQGERSVITIIEQLRRIRKAAHHFDAVAIIRGGGGDVGLSSYNNYELSREIALFPIPVFTGIGHSTNETVSEMVSFRNAITPTELADFLIQAFHNFAGPVRDAEKTIVEQSLRILREERVHFHNTVRYFQSVTSNRLLRSRNTIDAFSRSLIQHSGFFLKQEHHQLENRKSALKKAAESFLSDEASSLSNLANHVRLLDPIHILKRGFTMTMDQSGKIIKDTSELHVGDSVTTIFAQGQVTSEVKNISEQ